MLEIKNNLKFNYINNNIFSNLKDEIITMIEKIWLEKDQDSIEAKIAVNKYFAEGRTGKYYLIENNANNIGISGYYEIDPANGIFGLRHHGILPEYRGNGIGKFILNQLIENIISDGYDKFTGIVEMVPKGSISIEESFKKMGFEELKGEYLNHHKIKIQLEGGYYGKTYIFKK